MKRDPRYSDIRALYESGRINYFADIYERVGKTRLAIKMGMRVDRFNKYMEKVETFTLEHIIRIASLCDLDLKDVMEIWREEYIRQKEKRLGK